MTMPDPPRLPLVNLPTRRAALVDALSKTEGKIEPRIQALDAMIREAETWIHRRAAYNARDRACYRAGAAFEPYGGHTLDDVKLSGLDALGGYGIALLADIAALSPTRSLSQLIAALFASKHGILIYAWGAWARWHWCQSLYLAETADFLASPAAAKPHLWRPKTVTPRQAYLVEEIVRIAEIPAPKLATRGEAFDWIDGAGGNPRFTTHPPQPPLPALGNDHA